MVIGEHLFLDTYDLVRLLTAQRSEGKKIPPVIASGGVVDIGGVIDILAAGANAIQLCSAFDLRGVHMLPLLRKQLSRIGSEYKDLASFSTALVTDPSVWHDAAEEARRLRVQPIQAVQALLNDDQKLTGYFSAALDAEEPVVNEANQAAEKIELAKGKRLAFTKGNLSTFLVGARLSEEGAFRFS